jgi:hypothetical protein
VLGLLVAACNATPDLPAGWDLGGNARAYHSGPYVAAGPESARRFCEPLFAALPDGVWAKPTADLGQLAERLAPVFGKDPRTALVRRDVGGQDLLVAVVIGAEFPSQVVALAVDTDTGTGPEDAAWVAAGALALVRAIDGEGQARNVPRNGLGADIPADRLQATHPRRSVAFVFGVEPVEGILQSAGDAPLAVVLTEGIFGDANSERSVVWMERSPDPAMYAPLFPDPPREAMPRGVAGIPNGLALLGRMALVDSGTVSRPWASSEHPFRAKSALAPLADAGVAGIRIHRPNRGESRALADFFECERMLIAVIAAVAATADAQPLDLRRLQRSLSLERRLRSAAALDQAQDEALAEEWDLWLASVSHWCRRLCLGLALDGTED